MSGLTERQQLARAMAESASMAPAEAAKRGNGPSGRERFEISKLRDGRGREGRGGTRSAMPRTPGSAIAAPKTPGSGHALYGAFEVNSTGRKLSRVEKELASLAPWAWDPRAGTHAPGPSALRDFSEVVADKVIAASASGRAEKIQPKTFDRTLLSAGKTPGGREETPAPMTAPERAGDGCKRNRASMKAANLTPVALANTLDRVAAASAKKPKRASERTKALATANEPQRVEDITEKENRNRQISAKTKTEKIAPRPALRDNTAKMTNGASAKGATKPSKKELATPTVADEQTAKRSRASSKETMHVQTPQTAKAFQTPVPSKKKARAFAVEGLKTPAKEARTAASALRESFVLEMALARTYVKAIKRPIIPAAKPSKRLLEAYRAFSRACATNREVRSISDEPVRIITPGVALKRGLDILRAEDQSATVA